MRHYLLHAEAFEELKLILLEHLKRILENTQYILAQWGAILENHAYLFEQCANILEDTAFIRRFKNILENTAHLLENHYQDQI